MSRIEEALKKAAHKRQMPASEGGERPAPSPAFSRTAQPSQRVDVLLEVDPLEIENVLIATAREEKTVVVEEYNKLRSAIIALTKGDKAMNTLLVTSTASQEGKSMTSLNLAISLAKEHDHTVLLVDADLRRPSLHRYLGIKPEVGLVHCLRDQLPLEKALIKTGIGKLVVLPAGEAIKDPLDMLSSNQMKDIVRELKERYSDRYVIFDTPPALPFADAGVLSGMVDSTLFVVREGVANRDDLLKTLADFKDHNLLGIVYNDAHAFMKKQDYYYY
ncbi:XrtA-associated tyrosine autokinase [Pelobacter seleniigenes]|uniref:XrtA-associated tyrosine autokinase n=1 Tax=Pelobacter seleniigenes TaxID=407188 RepID=UPI0004A74663|nr:XrtA-associated tyrosine autokinase [Pelobacter seleniigenes]